MFEEKWNGFSIPFFLLIENHREYKYYICMYNIIFIYATGERYFISFFSKSYWKDVSSLQTFKDNNSEREREREREIWAREESNWKEARQFFTKFWESFDSCYRVTWLWVNSLHPLVCENPISMNSSFSLSLPLHLKLPKVYLTAWSESFES